MAIVLHEDKQYYPSAQEIYGEGVETMVQERDAQDLSEPIIAPVKVNTHMAEERDLPELTYSREWQASLMQLPDHIRNIALVGQLHHGKTSFLDMLINETHIFPPREGRKQDVQQRYTDTHILEQKRGITIKSSPISLVLKNTKGKSFLFNIMDTPGHSNFLDEVSIAARYADGFVLVVDVLEGLLTGTKHIIDYAIKYNIPLVLVLNKIDRLIVELKLPPTEALYKIQYTIDQVNSYINSKCPFKNKRYLPFSPELNNVVFSSSTCNFIFTLKSFALKYQQEYSADLDVEAFAKRLWGNIFYNKESRKFTRKPVETGAKRTFEHFILIPLYKIFTHVLEEEKDSLSGTLAKLNISLKNSTYKLDVKPLLQTVFKLFFEDSSALVDSILEHFPSPTEGSQRYLERFYSGSPEGIEYKAMLNGDPKGPLVVHVAKLYNRTDIESGRFYALGRVMSGTLWKNANLSVLGETYTNFDFEDLQECVASELWNYQSRYKVPIDGVTPGNWVLIQGVDSSITKTGTIYQTNELDEEEMHIFKPIKYLGEPVLKVAVEPYNPSELPKMLDGLLSIAKSYGAVQTKAEESGEHVIIGTGEMYMDCVLHDLRTVYANMHVKVSDPVAKFAETCLETSAIRAYTETPNKHNKITIIAEPLSEEICDDIENEVVTLGGPIDKYGVSGRSGEKWTPKKVAQFFQEKYGWDIMSARSIWSFGPEISKPNILQDDTLSEEVDKLAMKSIKEAVKQGFQWAIRDGPLCDEPIRNVRFKIIEAELSKIPSQRNSSQIISTVRRACYSAMLLASPRLMEPLYQFEIIVPFNHIAAVKTIVQTQRRGHIDTDTPLLGTPLRILIGDVPVIDSAGFETDIRIITKGAGFISSLQFYKWSIVPGDPLDKDQDGAVRPLEVASPQSMAREFVIKTRKRKGLSDQPTVTKYLDESLLESLKDSGLLD